MLGPPGKCGPPPYYCNESIPLQCSTLPRAVPVKSWAVVKPDTDAIKAHLATYGPLSALLDATGLQRYKSGK